MSINIPQVVKGNTINDIISITKNTPSLVTNLFGIAANALLDFGISQAFRYIREARFEEGIQQQVSDLVNNSAPIYAPDAIPDGKGGFFPSSNNFWNGRLSSFNNLPVMTSLTFVGTSYTSLSGQVITVPTITFEMVMVSMKKGKNIEKTDITGRDTGSVKEYISAKDWQISIKAVVTASQNVSDGMNNYYQTGKYPEENMEMIDILLAAPIAIQIICPYIQRRVNQGGNVWLVFDEDSCEISQIEGEYEAQRLNMNCLTDFPLIVQVATGS